MLIDGKVLIFHNLKIQPCSEINAFTDNIILKLKWTVTYNIPEQNKTL